MKTFEDFFYRLYHNQIDNHETIKILDIGGTFKFWKAMDFSYKSNCEITLVNILKLPDPDFDLNGYNIFYLQGDGTDLKEIQDKEFNFVFSNSCIEHVGKEPEWRKMANEIKRVSDHFFLQTPNRFFMIEPHFLFPFFQFLPLKIKAFLINHFSIGQYSKRKTWDESISLADSIKLLSYHDLRSLFPDATIEREKIFVFTKSFMVYK